MKRLLPIILLLLTALSVAQPQPVHWSGKLVPPDARAGENAQLVVSAKIDAGYHIYALQQPDGVLSTSLKVLPNQALTIEADPVQPFPTMKRDETLKTDVGTFSGEVSFGIPVKLAANAKGDLSVDVMAASQACDASACLPPHTQAISIAFTVSPGEARGDHLNSMTDPPVQGAGYVEPKDEPAPPKPQTIPKADDKPGAQPDEGAEFKSMPFGQFLWSAVIAGLLALLTPCVFPILPVTVSYFAKRATAHPEQKYSGPLAYAGGIVATFTLVGLAVSLVAKGARAISNFAALAETNLILGLVFVVLALSLFGVYELQMPSWLIGKASQGRSKGGLLGPLMMGLTFSLTSFTCTVGFVGSLLAVAVRGDVWFAAVGLFVFGLTFALPFFLLALFPGALNKLPRAGDWMATLKASMGFLELVAALKFFSNADLAKKFGILPANVFIALSAAILFMGAVYLFGWMVLPHHDTGKIGWLRRGFAVAFAASGVFLLSSMTGKSLGDLNAFLPPDPYPFAKTNSVAQAPHAGPITEADWLDSYDSALAKAKQTGQEILVDFTGYT